MQKKSNFFHTFWHDDKWLKENASNENEFDYSEVDEVVPFKGTHPKLMHEKVAAQDWKFEYDRSKAKFTFKNRVLHFIEKKTGWRIGEYKNYKII
jgi:hypothetical protein